MEETLTVQRSNEPEAFTAFERAGRPPFIQVLRAVAGCHHCGCWKVPTLGRTGRCSALALIIAGFALRRRRMPRSAATRAAASPCEELPPDIASPARYLPAL